MARITLTTLECKKTTDDPGSNDEVYLELKNDGLHGRVPERYWEMTQGDLQRVDKVYDYIQEFTVLLKESDSGKNDILGEFTFVTSIAPPGSPLVFTGSGGDYRLSFTLS